MKYVIVTGGVVSGLGKGIVTASLGKLLQSAGIKVTAIKIDPYLNVDAGTMNPFEHGEIFVTQDGGEIDQDMGHYERFLNMNLTKNHNITTGQIYKQVIEAERRGDYLGKTVQIIPHITDAIKERIRKIASADGAEVCFVEIGGTVGDIEGMPFLEAVRQMRLEEGEQNVVFVHVTLVPVLDVVGEPKTKPTQHSVRQLMEAGITPDMILCRCKCPLPPDVRRKISLFCNVPESAVFSVVDTDNIYEIPLLFKRDGLLDRLLERLGLRAKHSDLTEWERLVERMRSASKRVRIAIVGKYVRIADTYLSINEALKHAAAHLDAKVEISWIDAEHLEPKVLSSYDGVVVPGGFGVRGAEGKISAIRFARENKIPFLGLCFGFQLAVVEFARNVLKLDASSTELDPSTPHPVIDLLPEQKSVTEKGGTMRLGAHEIVIKKNTLAYSLYKRERIFERHRHRYEVNPRYVQKLERAGLVFSGKSPDKRRMEILELPGHPFFLATQFHPEFTSRLENPSPVFLGFVKSSLRL